MCCSNGCSLLNLRMNHIYFSALFSLCKLIPVLIILKSLIFDIVYRHLRYLLKESIILIRSNTWIYSASYLLYRVTKTVAFTHGENVFKFVKRS